jgi:hypothetical protein
MKIKQLIKELSILDPELEVILSSDAEGNSYHELDEIDYKQCGYKKQRYEIYIGLTHLTKEDADAGYTEEDVLTGAKPCVIFYPR